MVVTVTHFHFKNLSMTFFLKAICKNNYNIPILSRTASVQTQISPDETAKRRSVYLVSSLDRILSLPQEVSSKAHLDSYIIQFSTDIETKWYIRRVNTVSSLPFSWHSIQKEKQTCICTDFNFCPNDLYLCIHFCVCVSYNFASNFII